MSNRKTASRVGAQQPKVRLLKKRRVFVFKVPLILAKKAMIRHNIVYHPDTLKGEGEVIAQKQKGSRNPAVQACAGG